MLPKTTFVKINAQHLLWRTVHIPKNVCYVFNFQKTARSQQSPKIIKLGQSGHPVEQQNEKRKTNFCPLSINALSIAENCDRRILCSRGTG
jgi:hypothetical protein